jgi:predicted nuclease of predicted toxin-antitoxin system
MIHGLTPAWSRRRLNGRWRAAEHFNTCRAQGVQGSNTDFPICAVAERRSLPILTTDTDFTRLARILPITLYGREAG